MDGRAVWRKARRLESNAGDAILVDSAKKVLWLYFDIWSGVEGLKTVLGLRIREKRLVAEKKDNKSECFMFWVGRSSWRRAQRVLSRERVRVLCMT